MTDDALTPMLRQAARGRDAELGPVGEIAAHRLERMRAVAAECPGQPQRPGVRRSLAALAAVICLGCGGLWSSLRPPAPEAEPKPAFGPSAALAVSPLLLTPRPEASLLDEDEIRLELVATAPAPNWIFALPQDGGWPAVGTVQAPGGRGL